MSVAEQPHIHGRRLYQAPIAARAKTTRTVAQMMTAGAINQIGTGITRLPKQLSRNAIQFGEQKL